MTQQGLRQARWRELAGTSFTYNGDLISAGEIASGLTGLTFNQAELYICRSISGRQDQSLPNVQAAAAERLGVPGGWDSVGNELPIFGWDFTSGGEFPDLTYNTLVSGAVSRDSLIYVSSGVARASSLGLLSEKQSTNKCTNTNMKPTDTSGTTAQPAFTTHEAVALGSLPTEVLNTLPVFTPGKLTAVYHSVSNAGANISVAGVTGNTNTHTPSMWVYLVSGAVSVAVSGGTNSFVTTTGQWIRIENPQTTPGAAATLNVAVNQASELYWFGNQLEEKAGRSSLIEVNGSAVTRLGDDVVTAISGVDPTSFVASVEYSKFLDPVSPNPDRALVLTGVPSLQDQIIPITNVARLTDSTDTIDGPAYVLDTISRRAGGNDGTTRRGATGGTFDGFVTTTPPSEYTTIHFGVLPGSLRQIDGYIRNVAIYDEPATQAAVERLSA